MSNEQKLINEAIAHFDRLGHTNFIVENAKVEYPGYDPTAHIQKVAVVSLPAIACIGNCSFPIIAKHIVYESA